MKVEILSIDEAESRGWDDMIMNHPLGSVFHHTSYGKVIQSTFNHMTPYYVSLIGTDGNCKGGLVLFLVRSWLTGNRLVSIPWAAYGDPLIRSSEEFELLFEEVNNLSQRVNASYVQINSRKSRAFLNKVKIMTPIEYDKAHLLDLTKGQDTVWQGLHKSIRRRIRKTERNGIEVRLAQSEVDIFSFYSVWCRHRKILGLPAHRLEYFQNMWKYLASKGMMQIWIAEKKGDVLGGQCTFILKGTEFLTYIAAEGEFRQAGGGVAIIWAVICSAFKNEINTIDFGKTPIGANNLKSFKESWGAKEIETPVFYYPRIMGVSSFQDEKKLSYRAMRYFWKIAPPQLSKFASSFFWRHTG